MHGKTLEERVRAIETELFACVKTLEEFALKAMASERDIANMVKILKADDELHKLHRRSINNINMELEKFEDAYYHVFPDRLKQDVETAEQMDKIQGKSGDADKPKE